jgi:hypothetical protein
MPAPTILGLVCSPSVSTVTVTADVDPNQSVTFVYLETSLVAGGPYTPGGYATVAAGDLPVPVAVHALGLPVATVVYWRVVAVNDMGTTRSGEESCATLSASSGSGPIVDDRIFEIGNTILAAAQACLGDRCFPFSGVFPSSPDAPCDLLGIRLADDQPIMIPDEMMSECQTSVFRVNFDLFLRRCCQIPGPDISDSGQVRSWLNLGELGAVARRLQRDLLTVWQCLSCRREELFGTCLPLTVESARVVVDSCYEHTIRVGVEIPSLCCNEPGCDPILIPAVPTVASRRSVASSDDESFELDPDTDSEPMVTGVRQIPAVPTLARGPRDRANLNPY